MPDDVKLSVLERERLAAAAEKLRGVVAREMRGRTVPTARASRAMAEIAALSSRMKEIDAMQAHALRVQNLPIEAVYDLIAVPLMADALNDFVAGITDTLYKAGLAGTRFMQLAGQIQRAAMELVDVLAVADGLPLMVEHDDTLVDAIRKKVHSYVKQHTKKS